MIRAQAWMKGNNLMAFAVCSRELKVRPGWLRDHGGKWGIKGTILHYFVKYLYSASFRERTRKEMNETNPSLEIVMSFHLSKSTFSRCFENSGTHRWVRPSFTAPHINEHGDPVPQGEELMPWMRSWVQWTLRVGFLPCSISPSVAFWHFVMLNC